MIDFAMGKDTESGGDGWRLPQRCRSPSPHCTPAIDALTDEVIDGLRAQLPSYAAVSVDQLRPRVLASLRNGLSLVQRWSEERRTARAPAAATAGRTASRRPISTR